MDAVGLRGVAGNHQVGRHILEDEGRCGSDHVGADPAELVHTGKPAEDDQIVDRDMPGQRGAVGKDGLVGDVAVVRDVHVGHDPVVVADAGHPAALYGARIEGAELADGVAVADFQPRRLAGIFLVLRHLAQRAELEDVVVAPDAGVALDDDMRTDDGVVADLDMRTDDRIGADLHVGADPGARIDDRRGVDHLRHPSWRRSGGPPPPARHRRAPRP